MPDGLTYNQPALPGFPVPPLSAPGLSERVMIKMAAERIKEAVAQGRTHEATALADCVFQLSSGYRDESPEDARLRVEEAHEAWAEAEQLRRMGA